MLTMQTAQHHAIAGASETAGSHVFRPRERPPTQLHQAPSQLQRCAHLGVRLRHSPPNIHYLNLPIILARIHQITH
jgi:hypothetical protein